MPFPACRSSDTLPVILQFVGSIGLTPDQWMQGGASSMGYAGKNYHDRNWSLVYNESMG